MVRHYQTRAKTWSDQSQDITRTGPGQLNTLNLGFTKMNFTFQQGHFICLLLCDQKASDIEASSWLCFQPECFVLQYFWLPSFLPDGNTMNTHVKHQYLTRKQKFSLHLLLSSAVQHSQSCCEQKVKHLPEFWALFLAECPCWCELWTYQLGRKKDQSPIRIFLTNVNFLENSSS